MSAFTDVDRARVRAQVGAAGRILQGVWPLRTFVAVNPLTGLESRPFEEAVALAGELIGFSGHPSLERFRAWHAEGRITDDDLDGALLRRLPELGEARLLKLAGTTVGTLALLRADLLHGAEVPQPQRLPRGAGEWCDRLLGTAVATSVDAEVARWCAAFCDTTNASLAMPGREHGLYRAWRELVPRSPALRRLGLARASFEQLPERPEDAILAALELMRIPERERRAELRAQLARLPGFSSHIKWCQEHPDQASNPADLTDLLAIRLTYESALVDRAAAERLAFGSADLRALVEEQLDARALAAQTTAEAWSSPQGLARARAVAQVVAPEVLDGGELEALATVLEQLPPAERAWVWLDAYEWHYRDQLLAMLGRQEPPPDPGRPLAQAVFCIDTRSEGIRRQLERRGKYHTFGFAGFYQLVMRYRMAHVPHEAWLCPVPLTPTKVVVEAPASSQEAGTARGIELERHAGALNHAFHAAKDDLATPFALAEAGGWPAGALMLAKTLAPRGYASLRARAAALLDRGQTRVIAHSPGQEEAETLVAASERQAIRALLGRPGMTLEECEALRVGALLGREPRIADELGLTPELHAGRVSGAMALGYDLAEQLDWAEFALRSFGLVSRFARIVLLAGHGSSTENNAYEAALDCGACGGQRGGPNARVSAALLNRPDVRAGLASRGIEIPGDTWFLAAEHDTAVDRVLILDTHAVPATHREEVARLQFDLDAAGEALAAERDARLPGPDHPRRRARDWAQVRPEWGLARNAAFVIGPGEMVAGLDLECRTFLHSYDWRADPDASALETILTAPGLVVQWINAQYYFAATDPEVLGAGDKTLHNVIGDVGVLQGFAGDLRLGLPWQSLAVGGELYHEPMRALYVVQAPRERVQMLIERNELLRNYFDGEWLALVVREGRGEPWFRRRRDGTWEAWRAATDHANDLNHTSQESNA